MGIVATNEDEDPASDSVAGSLIAGQEELSFNVSAAASASTSASLSEAPPSPSTSGHPDPASVRKERKSLSDAFFGGAREEILARSISVSHHAISSASPSKRASLRRAGSGANRSNRRAYRRPVAANDPNDSNPGNGNSEPSASDGPTTPGSRRSSRTIGSSRSLPLDSGSRHTPTTPRRSLHKNGINVSNHVARKRTTVAPAPAAADLADDADVTHGEDHDEDDPSVMTWTRESITTSTAAKAKSTSDLLSRSSHRSSHRRASAMNLGSTSEHSRSHSRSCSRIRTRGRDTEEGGTPVEVRVRSRSRSSRLRHRSTTNLGGGAEPSQNANTRSRRSSIGTSFHHDEGNDEDAFVELNDGLSSPPLSFPIHQRGKSQDADGLIASESDLFFSPQISPESPESRRQKSGSKNEEFTGKSSTHYQLIRRSKSDDIDSSTGMARSTSPTGPRRSREFLPYADAPLHDGSPSPRQGNSEHIDGLVGGVPADADADAETRIEQLVTPGTRRRYRGTAPYAVAPLKDEPRESSFRACRRSKSQDANTIAGMEPTASPGHSRRRNRSKSRDSPPIHVPFNEDLNLTTASLPRRSNSQDEDRATAQIASPGTRRQYRSKNRDLASLLSPGDEIDGRLIDGVSLSLAEHRNSATPTTARRRIKSSQVQPPDELDLFAAADPITIVSPVTSKVAPPETACAEHDDFFYTPSSSRLFLEEAEGPSVGTSQQQSQPMIAPARLKGLKNFLGSTTIIKKFQKGGPSPVVGDMFSRVGEIPKPIVVHPVEIVSPAPLNGHHQPPVPVRKRNELIRNVFSPETRSRRGQHQLALTSKMMGDRAATIGASHLLSARRGGSGPGTFQSFDDSGVISSYVDTLKDDDCSMERVSHHDRTTESSREPSPTRQHQISNIITDPTLPSSFSSTVNTSGGTLSDSVPYSAESNQSERELEGVLSNPLRQEGMPQVPKNSLHDLFNVDDGQALDDQTTTMRSKTKESSFRGRSEKQLDQSQHSLMTLEEQKQFLQLHIPAFFGSSASTLVVTQHDIVREVPAATQGGTL